MTKTQSTTEAAEAYRPVRSLYAGNARSVMLRGWRATADRVLGRDSVRQRDAQAGTGRRFLNSTAGPK